MKVKAVTVHPAMKNGCRAEAPISLTKLFWMSVGDDLISTVEWHTLYMDLTAWAAVAGLARSNIGGEQ